MQSAKEISLFSKENDCKLLAVTEEVGGSIRQQEFVVDSGDRMLEVQEQAQKCVNRA